jgi:dTDP-4-dehydrorhamnose reductase
MKILITGAGGQLAWELQRSAPSGYQVTCLPRSQLDIADPTAVAQCFAQILPDAVINAAAYTAVDKAETDRDRAMAVNARGVGYLAQASECHGSYMLHISTDFVFDGRGNQPYGPADKVNPLGVYGASKLAGERELAATMGARWSLVRTSWVYSSHGANFVKTMLKMMREKSELRIVSDQIGTPTWAAGLASVCWRALGAGLKGKYHWSDAGVASWYDFAIAIQWLALDKGLLQRRIPIIPIRTSDYPTAALRPAYSVLDKSDLLEALPSLQLQHWLLQLSDMLDELKKLA